MEIWSFPFGVLCKNMKQQTSEEEWGEETRGSWKYLEVSCAFRVKESMAMSGREIENNYFAIIKQMDILFSGPKLTTLVALLRKVV